MKNKIVVMSVLVLILFSFTVVAEEDSCSGFFGTIKCVLWGSVDRWSLNVISSGASEQDAFLISRDPTVRANLAGEAYQRNLAGKSFYVPRGVYLL